MQKLKNFFKENNFFCFFILFFFLSMILYDDNSFLYKYSIQYDEGVYLNVAKEMFKGKIPYKDIYDHKGPIIFFIYKFLYLISIPGTTSGVFFYNFFCIIISLYYIYKILNLFHEKIESKIIFFILYSFFISSWFKPGGVPELLVMSFFSYLVYFLFSKKYLTANLFELYFISIFSGIIFLLKYNLIIVPFIFFCFYFFKIIIKKNRYKDLFHCFLGFLIPILIIFLYFLKNNALTEFLQVYFIENSGYRTSMIPSSFGNFLLFVVLFSSIFVLNLIEIQKNKSFISEFIILYISLFFFIIFQFILSNRYYFYYVYPCFPFFSVILFSFRKFKERFLTIVCLLLAIVILISAPFFKKEYSHIIFNSKESNYIEDLRNILKEGDNVFSLKVSPGVFNNFEGIINDYYFYFPNHSYKQNPNFYEKLLENIKYKGYDYIIAKEETVQFEEEIFPRFSLSYDIYEDCNKDILNKCFKYLKENYERIELSDFEMHNKNQKMILLRKK